MIVLSKGEISHPQSMPPTAEGFGHGWVEAERLSFLDVPHTDKGFMPDVILFAGATYVRVGAYLSAPGVHLYRHANAVVDSAPPAAPLTDGDKAIKMRAAILTTIEALPSMKGPTR
jgi:hypothetical protein